MKKRPTLFAAAATAFIAVSASCAEPEPAAPYTLPEQTATTSVLSMDSSEKPLPADQVFVPDAHIDDGALFFRIQLLPGYYLYKDKISVRSLSSDVALGDYALLEEWSQSETVFDEWFGEQAVYFDEAHGSARVEEHAANARTFDIELSYQGCKQDGICYVPQTKILSVAIPASLESATGPKE
jgi:thiol:disulfide interchange protein DsbD